jgi:hypothetical protein
MEHLLAYHVVKDWKYDAKVQLPVTSVHGVYPLSRLMLMAEFGSVFTSHREDVHLQVGHLSNPISQGLNEL